MTKSQNTKNEQQKDLCITSEQLTEQWKKGELPSGYYYVKNEFGNIFPSDYSESYDSINDAVIKDFFTEVSEITEVIAKVPSYGEYDNILKCYEYAHKQNAQLKELLKEVKDYLPEFETPMNILAKIDEALK